MDRLRRIGGMLSRVFLNRYAWVAVGAVATLLGGWLVVTRPTNAPTIAGMGLAPVLYYLQWVIYAAIIVLLGVRLLQYRKMRTPRQDIAFVFGVVFLYTVGFMLYYTPFVYAFPEGPLAAVVRTGVMMLCGLLGAMYGLSSTHRWR